MIFLKTSLSSSGLTIPSDCYQRSTGQLAGMPPAMVEDDDAPDQAVSHTANGSSESLVDSMSSGTATTTCSMLSGSSRRLTKPASYKSSFALTSLLQQQKQQLHQDMVDSSQSMSNLSCSLESTPLELPTAFKSLSPSEFGQSLQNAICLGGGEQNINVLDNKNIRQVLEAPLKHARSMRESCRRASAFLDGMPMSTSFNPSDDTTTTNMPLSGWVGLPYAGLRDERPFLYDHMHTHPLSDLLSQALGMPDLSLLHKDWNPNMESAKDHQRRMFAPLLDRWQRQPFQKAYDCFVQSCCLPLLHAAALRGNVFNSSNRQHHSINMDPVLYRYQVFPTINVIYPNDLEACSPPSCDLSQGKSVGWLHFHVPLTPSQGTSSLYCERYPGREDWHALQCTQGGLGYCWDGARCLSFCPLNTTGLTRVSLDFRILLVRSSTASAKRNMPQLSRNAAGVDDDTLCRGHHLQDALTRLPGFYKEANMDYSVGGGGASSAAASNDKGSMMDPDARCGFPFA